MRKQNADPNKCVAFNYDLVAVYQELVKQFSVSNANKNKKIT